MQQNEKEEEAHDGKEEDNENQGFEFEEHEDNPEDNPEDNQEDNEEGMEEYHQE